MILAIDLGSTAFKAAVIDEKLRVQGFCAVQVHHRFGAGATVELAVAEACSALRKAIRTAIRSAGIRPSEPCGVAITSQAQTFTIQAREGRPQTPFISWQDNRAALTCKRLKETKAMLDFGRHCSFGSLLPPLLLCQLKHLHDSRPGFLGTDNWVVCLPTFFVQQWCGISVLDENLAAMSGLYSLALGKWWPAALRVCALTESQLPAICRIGAVVGRTNAGGVEFGLPKGIPVILAGNDQTAGACAARLDENGGLLLTLGTAQVAYTSVRTLPPPDAALVRGPFPGRGYYRMAADSSGGSVINWARTLLAGCGTDERFFKVAARSPGGCRGLRFEPNCDQYRGTWSQIQPHHTAADFARSILEGLARRMKDLVARLGVRLDQKQIFVAGGGSNAALWVDILSQTLGAPLTVTEGRPCVGAARMAWRALGQVRN
jgi:sugar (pentulose or hexulose) kinase